VTKDMIKTIALWIPTKCPDDDIDEMLLLMVTALHISAQL